MLADVMCCEAEAGAATPKVRPCRTPGHPPCSCSWLVARCCARARAANVCAYARPAAQTCAWPLKALLLAIACGLSALWARVGVWCGPIAPRWGKRCPKLLLGSCVRGWARRVRSAREWAADARRLVFMSRPSFGGGGALRGGDHEHQQRRHHLQQEARILAPRAPAWLKVYVIMLM